MRKILFQATSGRVVPPRYFLRRRLLGRQRRPRTPDDTKVAGTLAGIAEPVDSSLRATHRPVSLPVLHPAGVMRADREPSRAPRRLPAGIGPEETSPEEISQ